VIDLLPLGLSDYKAGHPNNNALDPTDRDNVPQGFPNNNAKINQWPVYGLYQPDEIEAFTHKGDTYLVLANEGDAREDWVPYVESKRVADAGLDPKVFPDAAELVKPGALGRLLVSTALTSGSDLTSIRAFGARSFSILRMFKNGKGYSMVYNSGRLLEELTKDLDATSPVNDTCTLRNGVSAQPSARTGLPCCNGGAVDTLFALFCGACLQCMRRHVKQAGPTGVSQEAWRSMHLQPCVYSSCAAVRSSHVCCSRV